MAFWKLHNNTVRIMYIFLKMRIFWLEHEHGAVCSCRGWLLADLVEAREDGDQVDGVVVPPQGVVLRAQAAAPGHAHPDTLQ